MTDSPARPWLHRLAVLTACTALFTIAVGTAVTTKKAGMAFPDWPTSDGYGMFTYPWWRSAGDKFLEHGHRLAGIAIGIASLILFVALAWKERRRGSSFWAAVVLLAVILQGLLGGFRVRLNAEDLALIHGSGAAMVFALTVGVAVVTSRAWRRTAARRRDRPHRPVAGAFGGDDGCAFSRNTSWADFSVTRGCCFTNTWDSHLSPR